MHFGSKSVKSNVFANSIWPAAFGGKSPFGGTAPRSTQSTRGCCWKRPHSIRWWPHLLGTALHQSR